MDIGLLGQYVMNGLMLGMMYALVAVGFTLFFGVLDVINFSHGDVLTGGALTGLAASLAAASVLPAAEPSEGSPMSSGIRYCLNTSTVRGQNLTIEEQISYNFV